MGGNGKISVCYNIVFPISPITPRIPRIPQFLTHPTALVVPTNMELIIGRGLIGKGLYYHLRRYGEVTLVPHDDVLDGKYSIGDGVVYNCSGVTKTRECEEHPVESGKVNIENTIEIAKKFPYGVWISSERVFDGSIADAREVTCPNTEYGRQKVEAEGELLGLGWGVIRLSKVIGWSVPLFEEWADDLAQGKEIHPFDNMSMAPISLETCVETLRKMGQGKMTGLYQLSGDRDIKYADIARFICMYKGKDVGLVKPVRAEVSHEHTTLKSDFERADAWDMIYAWCRENIQPDRIR